MNARQHLAAIQSGSIDGTTVRGLKKAINADRRERQGWSTSSTAPKLRGGELAFILRELAEREPVVTGPLHASGLALLQGKRYAKRLRPVAAIVRDIARFRLTGYTGENATPIYRAEAENGRGFTFYNVAWQSGGDGPVIVSEF